MNIVTIKGQYMRSEVAEKYLLVPDKHEGRPDWYKIVVMEHVTQGQLDEFLMDLGSEVSTV